VLVNLCRYLQMVDTELLTTALAVHIDVANGTATVASAGHLPPLIVAPSPGGWQAHDVALEVGPPLGVGSEWHEHTTSLPHGGMLLLYTDGLVETRAWPLDHGLELLRSAMRALSPEAGPADALNAALELVPTGSRGDDVAVLAAAMP
jgi:serine phosphatase RsbU (regulator of sigma subunit)